MIQTPTPLPESSNNFLANSDIPISQAKNRMTKKSFGIFISPQHSPINPERFTGYHTGADFEIFFGEENKDVVITALCDGTLALKEVVSGYGGVAVERCILDKQIITVIYGHLNLASVETKSESALNKGDKIGVLGRGFSPETDGERKHLHLGVHKGPEINIRGYVQKFSDLSSWIDPAQFLQ